MVEFWQGFKASDIEFQAVDDGEVAWAHLFNSQDDLIYMVWLYNVCEKREEVTMSAAENMVMPGIDPVSENERFKEEADVRCFSKFTEDGSDIEWVIFCVRGQVRAVLQQGEKFGYVIQPDLTAGVIKPLTYEVWNLIPQSMKEWVVSSGCQLI